MRRGGCLLAHRCIRAVYRTSHSLMRRDKCRLAYRYHHLNHTPLKWQRDMLENQRFKLMYRGGHESNIVITSRSQCILKASSLSLLPAAANHFVHNSYLRVRRRRIAEGDIPSRRCVSWAFNPMMTDETERVVPNYVHARVDNDYISCDNCDKKQGKMKISLNIIYPNATETDSIEGQHRELNRESSEIVDRSFARLSKAFLQRKDNLVKKKSKKQTQHERQEISFEIVEEDGVSVVDSSITTNYEAWISGRILRVCWQKDNEKVEEKENPYVIEYIIVRNDPEVVDIDLPKRSVAGIELHARVVTKFMGCSSGARAQWLRLHKNSNNDADAEWECVKEILHDKPEHIKIGESYICDNTGFACIVFSYVPSIADVDYLLKLKVSVGRSKRLQFPNASASHDNSWKSLDTSHYMISSTAVLVEDENVEQFGCVPRLEGEREQFLDIAPPSINPFRVVSYNLLADQYASQPFSKDVMFKYCDSKYLDIEYRKQIIAMELRRLQADIICLQEVDRKVFDQYLQPLLSFPNGSRPSMSGLHTTKGKDGMEGCALFVNSDRWMMSDTREVNVGQEITKIFSGTLFDVDGNINSSRQTNLKHACESISTVAQIALLQAIPNTDPTKSDQHLIVANTHLYFHPKAPHIRLLSIAAIMTVIDAFAKQHFCSIGMSSDYGVLLCGDLNSEPETAVMDYLTQGFVGKGSKDWADGKDFVFGKDKYLENKYSEEEEVEKDHSEIKGEDNEDDFPAVDILGYQKLSCGDYEKIPFTNFAGIGDDNYCAILDYIFVQGSNLRILSTLDGVSIETALLDNALPSRRFPSDHIPIMSRIDYKPVDSPSNLEKRRADNLAKQFAIPATNKTVEIAAGLLRKNKVIAIPTDTLYGFAAHAGELVSFPSEPSSIEKLYTMKGRNRNVPIAIMVSDIDDIACYACVDHLPQGLLYDLFPGRVTVLLPLNSSNEKNESLNTYPFKWLSPELNPGLATIGVRIPDNTFCRNVARASGGAIALTSANLSGHHSTIDVYEFQDLWHHCDAVFDGGKLLDGRSGSTIIKLTDGTNYNGERQFTIVRNGSDADSLKRLFVEKYKYVELL